MQLCTEFHKSSFAIFNCKNKKSIFYKDGYFIGAGSVPTLGKTKVCSCIPPGTVSGLKGRCWDVLPEGRERLEVDGLENVLGGVELQQQHDEYAVVRQLLEICLTDIMVLNQDTNYNTKHLEEERRTSIRSQLRGNMWAELCASRN